MSSDPIATAHHLVEEAVVTFEDHRIGTVASDASWTGTDPHRSPGSTGAAAAPDLE